MIFQISLALLCSYLVFSSARYLFSRFGITAPNLTLLRCSQLMLILSILVPTALHLVPEKKLPVVNFRVLRGYSEDTRVNLTSSAPEFFTQTESKEPSLTLVKNSDRLIDQIEAFFSSWLFYLWSFGVTFFFVRLMISSYHLNRILNHAALLRQFRSIRLVVSETISVPFSVKFFRTHWVVLPLTMLEQKTDLKIAIQHELQHHRQGDTSWAVLIEILQCLFYFNPALFGWKALITELQEFSCDEAMIGQKRFSKQDYGSCLVRVAETALENRECYAGTAYMAAVFKNPKAFKSLLRRRIEMMMQERKSARKITGSFLGTLTLMFTVTLAYGAEQAVRNHAALKTVVEPAIQKIADQALDRAIRTEGAQAGFAIVADPYSGRVLAVANIDLKDHKQGQWALSEELEPASLMKSVVVAEAIEKGVTTPTSMHNCENGVYHYGDSVLHDWKVTGWKKLSTTKAIANSSDICTTKIAEKLGTEKLRQMFSNYGFGAPADSSRIAPLAAFGMGFKSTPLEILQAYGAIANGGTLLAPKFTESKYDTAKVVRRVLSEENSKKMRTILREVVISGTASTFPSKLYTMAGKTASSFSGSTVTPESSATINPTDIAGFVGFAPALNPKVEIYVTIFHPSDKTGAHGSTHAVPVFSEIADGVLKYMNISPDRQKL